MPTMIEEKTALRREARARLSAIDADGRRALSASVCARLEALPEFERASTVFCFVGTAREIDTEAFLRRALHAGKRLCVPLCVAPGVMELRRIASLQALSPGAHGIMEPACDAPRADARQVDFAVIPCLACSREGLRLGQGGGYYDRFLARYQGFAVMVCPEALLMEHIPVEAHDRPVPRVLTERSYFVRKAPR